MKLPLCMCVAGLNAFAVDMACVCTSTGICGTRRKTSGRSQKCAALSGYIRWKVRSQGSILHLIKSPPWTGPRVEEMRKDGAKGLIWTSADRCDRNECMVVSFWMIPVTLSGRSGVTLSWRRRWRGDVTGVKVARVWVAMWVAMWFIHTVHSLRSHWSALVRINPSPRLSKISVKIIPLVKFCVNAHL
jgi:hypothetical protein